MQRSSSLQPRQPVSSETMMITGTVKWFNSAKGFGFIVPDNGMPDVMVHVTCLQRGGPSTVYAGATVRCEAVQTGKGLQCHRVVSVRNLPILNNVG